MAVSLLRPCIEPGCGVLSRSTRCPLHRHLPDRRRDARRRASGKPHSSLNKTPVKVRRAVLERDGFRCRYCGEAADTVDHVVPISAGGPSTVDNLVAACRRCNSSKGARRG